VRQRDAPRGPRHQFDAQPFFERVDTPADHRRGHALGLGRGRQAALGRHADERFDLLQLVHQF
jgi:hypothetical protein